MITDTTGTIKKQDWGRHNAEMPRHRLIGRVLMPPDTLEKPRIIDPVPAAGTPVSTLLSAYAGEMHPFDSAS